MHRVSDGAFSSETEPVEPDQCQREVVEKTLFFAWFFEGVGAFAGREGKWRRKGPISFLNRQSLMPHGMVLARWLARIE